MFKYIKVVILVLALSGCASTEMKKYTGHHIDQVITRWGAPNAAIKLSNGGASYTWTGGYDLFSQPCRKTFTTNSRGIIIQYNVSSDSC